MAKPVKSRAIFAALAVLFGFILSYMLISKYDFKPPTNQALDAGVSNIGSQLLSTTEHGYALPFEAVSILLLAAMIGCIVIAMKSNKGQETSIKAQETMSKQENNSNS